MLTDEDTVAVRVTLVDINAGLADDSRAIDGAALATVRDTLAVALVKALLSGAKLTARVYSLALRTVAAVTELAEPPCGVAVYARVPDTGFVPSVAAALRTPLSVVPYVTADG